VPDFLDLSPGQFRALDPARSYPVSWSLIQFLMSTPANRQILNELLDQYQTIEPPDGCAEILNQLYPGGLPRFEADWHEWVRLPFKAPFLPSPAPPQ
jgi:hypothetical protein